MGSVHQRGSQRANACSERSSTAKCAQLRKAPADMFARYCSSLPPDECQSNSLENCAAGICRDSLLRLRSKRKCASRNDARAPVAPGRSRARSRGKTLLLQKFDTNRSTSVCLRRVPTSWLCQIITFERRVLITTYRVTRRQLLHQHQTTPACRS